MLKIQQCTHQLFREFRKGPSASLTMRKNIPRKTNMADKNLIFWMRENAWSLVSSKAIVDGVKDIGGKISAKFQGKTYPALLIASK